MTQALEQYKAYLDKMEQYTHIITQLSWDMHTQTPTKGYPYKVDAITYFSTESFKLSTSEELGELLSVLSTPAEFDALDEAMQLTVRRNKKEYDRRKRIPADFYEEMVRESSISEKAWEEAKQKNDFPIFCPHLQKMIDFQKQTAKYMEPEKEVYDTLIDIYEEGMDSATIDRLFMDMKESLVPLLKKIMEKPEPNSDIFVGDYDVNKQKELGKFLLSYIGFDHEAGVMGESEHPFTMGFGPKDVRVTNHYYPNEAVNAMFSIIHEGGHAIFEQGVNPDYEKTAAATIDLLGLHESQSRFYENILGRNINFWKPIYEKVSEYLPAFKNISLEQFNREINHIRPSFIRTDADELTYNFHIILRYEVEKAIFRDGVKAEELPALWNQKTEELLGICPPDDAQGILQDMHWSDGSFGYFPTYLLGSIYDGMFLETMEKELGNIDCILAEGRIKDITKWLNEKVHQHGSMCNSRERVLAVCGKEVTAEPIIAHFKKKYAEIYELSR